MAFLKSSFCSATWAASKCCWGVNTCLLLRQPCKHPSKFSAAAIVTASRPLAAVLVQETEVCHLLRYLAGSRLALAKRSSICPLRLDGNHHLVRRNTSPVDSPCYLLISESRDQRCVAGYKSLYECRCHVSVEPSLCHCCTTR